MSQYKWKIFKWPFREHFFFEGKWFPDGKFLLIHKTPLSANGCKMSIYNPEGKEISKIPVDDFITSISSFKISPDGRKIYAVSVHSDHRLARKALFPETILMYLICRIRK